MEIIIISGFLGAGKTTFLNHYLPALKGRTIVVENEFGQVGVDFHLLKYSTPVVELNAGCVCCDLSVKLKETLVRIQEQCHPDQIVIEPSGVAKLSDLLTICQSVFKENEIHLGKVITIVDTECFEDYLEEFGLFYSDQMIYADYIFLSNTEAVPEENRREITDKIRNLNPRAPVFDFDFREWESSQIAQMMEKNKPLSRSSGEPFCALAAPFFSSVSILHPPTLTEQQLTQKLGQLAQEKYGVVLRAKGFVRDIQGKLMLFQWKPNTTEYRRLGSKKTSEKIVVIGTHLHKEKIRELFDRSDPNQ